LPLTNEIIAPLPCFGNVSFYRHLLLDDVIVDLHEHYVKQSLRNRYELCGAQGRFHLGVPVLSQGGKKLTSSQIRVSNDEQWMRQHWRSIRTNYSSAPFFDHYADQFEALYCKEFDLLVDFCANAHDLICDILNLPNLSWEKGLRFSEEYIQSTPGVDLRRPTKEGTGRTKPYIQVFSDRHDFQSDLSVIDVIMCCGPEASSIIKS